MNKKCISRNCLINLVSVCLNNQPYDYFFQNQLYTIIYSVYAKILTKSYSTWFGVSPTDQDVTHIFNIRYNSDIFNSLDTKLVIIYDNKSYEILKYENKNEDNKELIIYTTHRGSVTIKDIQYNENIDN